MSELADEIRAEADMASRAGQCKRLHDLADRTATLARELAEERERLARVEAVRKALLDRTQMVTEGPMIGRIKVDAMLRRALHAPADAPQGGQDDGAPR